VNDPGNGKPACLSDPSQSSRQACDPRPSSTFAPSARDTALLALDLGLSPGVPRQDGSKRPDGEWKEYQKSQATRDEVEGWFRAGHTGVGLFTGFGDVECFEFDNRDTYDDFLDAMGEAGLSELVDRIRSNYEESSPGGGIHWLYRCSEHRGNTKLAERPAPTEKDSNAREPLIETRGEGGWIVIAPSNGTVHPSGGAYTLLSGALGRMAVITPEEREALWLFAQTFDETGGEVADDTWEMPVKLSPFAQRATGGSSADDVKPGEAFNERMTWDDVLIPFGWTKVFSRGDVTYWRRPGKDRDWSATTGHCKGLKVFSSSTPFKNQGTYTKFGAYSLLNHRGDLREAAKALAAQGFGSQPKSKPAAGQPADSNIDDAEIVDRWPKMSPDAFYGLGGDIVRLCQDQTEADPVAILLQVLVAFANLVGRKVFFVVGGTRHYLNMFVALVGLTSVGRKGTSWDVARYPLSAADPDWAENRVAGGLVSGEGLIFHVRDPVIVMKQAKDPQTKAITKVPVETDAGVPDKRLLVIETEMGRMLKAMNRDTSTLSDVIRQCWDSGTLRTLNRKDPLKASGAHVSIVAHVTEADVQKHLTATDSANGFANRFLWVCARRSRVLPEGGDLFAENWAPIQERIKDAVRHARDPFDNDWTMTAGDGSGGRRMKRDQEARKSWHAVYEELSAGKAGLLGMVLSRAEAQVMRLACIYALLDCSDAVRVEHLGAALAVWDYCSASARLVFGDGLGDPDQEKLLKALRASPNGLTRTEIYSQVFGKHKSRDELVRLLSGMLTQGLIHRVSEPGTKGRPVERWLDGRDAH
jgi:hypothetical protein